MQRPPFSADQAALHEAAHVVVHLALGSEFREVVLDLTQEEPSGRVVVEASDLWVLPLAEVPRKLRTLLAGNLAIEFDSCAPAFGPFSYDDQEGAEFLAARAVSEKFGLNLEDHVDHIGHPDDPNVLVVDFWLRRFPDELRTRVREDFEALLESAERDARSILDEHRGVLFAIASELRTATGDMVGSVSFERCAELWADSWTSVDGLASS